MQATMNPAALAPRLQFARRDTMMRSEKRRRPDPQRPNAGGSNRRPPRRREPRAGFFYKLLMLILLLTLWPIGLIMLWRRKLHWSGLAKLFTSIITLMACILLVGFALTVETHNPGYTALQDSVNGFLDSAADSLIDFSVSMGERVNLSIESVSDIRALYQRQSLTRAADIIDQGVALATTVRERVGTFLEEIAGTPEATPVPDDAADETAEPGAEATEPSDAAEETPSATEAAGAQDEDEVEPHDSEEEELDAIDAEDVPDAPVNTPAVEITVSTADDSLPVYIPEGEPDADLGSPITGGVLSRAGALKVGALPTPSPEPTPEILRFDVKPAGEATVYFNIGSGKYYHMAPVCGSMKNADAHSFSEVAENIHEPCSRCTPPEKALLEEHYIAWIDESGAAHITDECPAFQGQWSLAAAQDAIDNGVPGCPICGADHYLAALADGKTVALNGEEAPASGEAGDGEGEDAGPSAEPTPAPTPAEPTPEPSPQVVTPRETLKPASRAIVYHSTNGKFYHMNDHCSGMTGGSPYSLSQCVDDGYKQCHTCNAPAPEVLEHNCLWVDEGNVCHVSDECEYFAGQYTLVDRDEALEQGMTACAHCGAADYLIPFTVMSTYQRLGEDDTL